MSSKATFAAFDVETTGLVPGVDRIVELAAVLFHGDAVVATHAQLVDPGIPMPPVAEQVNGISDLMLSGMPTLAAALPAFLALLGEGIPVAHNAVFDVGFVACGIAEAGLRAPAGPVLDTRELARRAFPRRQSYSLTSLVHDLHLGGEDAHRALADAHACRLLFLACVETLTGSRVPTPDRLQQLGMPALDFADHAPRLSRTAGFLQSAIRSGAAVEISYRGAGGAMTDRRIRPQSFTTIGGSVAVVAFCYLRGASRNFHLDAIVGMRESP